MASENVFHMAGGHGRTSYARNSLIQKKASDKAKKVILETIQEVYLTTAAKSFGIADLGCGSGPNTLSILKQMIGSIKGSCTNNISNSNDNDNIFQDPTEELRVYLNDLPNNDFNSIFKALPEFYKEFQEANDSRRKPAIYVGAYPGTFYGRLFPDNCLHFIYSNNSLHWLSRVPQSIFDKQGKSINKRNIYISESSPTEVSQAYFRQFQEDFSMFLRSRSVEVVAGGRMVLIVSGRIGPNHDDNGITLLWKLLSVSLATLVSQGQIEEEKLNAYNVQFYAPSEEELRNEVIREGSFQMDNLEVFEMDKDVHGDTSYGTVIAKATRAVQGPMICQHFGDGVLDSLFDIYGKLVDDAVAVEEIKPIYIVFGLRRI